MSKESGSGEFVAGFLLGAFSGAMLALLLTPVSGEEMRTQIRDKSIELKTMTEDLDVDELKTKGQSLLDQQKSRFREAIEEGKQAAARKKEELLSQLESGGEPQAIDLVEPAEAPEEA